MIKLIRPYKYEVVNIQDLAEGKYGVIVSAPGGEQKDVGLIVFGVSDRILVVDGTSYWARGVVSDLIWMVEVLKTGDKIEITI